LYEDGETKLEEAKIKTPEATALADSNREVY
jgi:hypothetical protein